MIDDLDLKKIEESGQCFRVKEIKPGLFRFVTGEHVVYVKQPDELVSRGDVSCSDSDCLSGNRCGEEVSYTCSKDEWATIWYEYFDFGRSYADVRNKIPVSDAYMRSAADCGVGIRILKQDPWEMLISFIISQRKAIPAIKSSIELLCQYFGRKIVTEYETIYLFPSAEEIAAKTLSEGPSQASRVSKSANAEATADIISPTSIPRDELMSVLEISDLKNCKLGYRLRYICDAVCKVVYKELDLDELRMCSSEDLLLKLKEVYGVGDKVANCIALFAYGRTENAPVDTWIKKVIENVYDGINPFPQYGENAGIMQQYIFYYALKHKSEF